MRALVTNDDGIDSVGLLQLAQAADRAGWQVTVAAPDREFSGWSAALTAVETDGRIAVEPRALPDLDGVPAFAVAASPAFIVHIAANGGFGPVPDIVLSGINIGANAGRAVLHSGTVGAALTAAVDGKRALAISLRAGGASATDLPWDTAATVAVDVLPAVAALPAGVVLNVNVPNLPYDQLLGVRRGTLASFGEVQLTVAEHGTDFVRLELADAGAELEPGTDEALLAAGYVAVTPLRPVGEALDVGLPFAAAGEPVTDRYPGQSR